MRNSPVRQDFLEKPWGNAFVREFDLTIAANVLQSMQSRDTLYNAQLNERLADRCMPLDHEVVNDFLGIVDVVPNPAESWKEVETALAGLEKHPRGTWAVLRGTNGCYDAWMANGNGGCDTDSGHKFIYTSPKANALEHQVLYAHVMSWAAYNHRKVIEDRIVEHSMEVGCPEVGAIAKDVHMAGKTWSKVEFLGVKDDAKEPTKFHLRATRPGVRKTEFMAPASSIAVFFRVPMVMPPEYDDPHNAARLRSLRERRSDAGQVAWDAFMATGPQGIQPRGTAGGWNFSEEAIQRIVWRDDETVDQHSARFKVTFAPGSDVVLDSSLVDERIEPVNHMRFAR